MQADNSTTRYFGGTGLGLAIAAELTRLMNGQIWVESEVGRGSCFQFTCQLQLDPLGAAAQPSFDQLAGMQVLVVDDYDGNRRIVAEYLRNWNMDPILASDAPSALDIIQQHARQGEPLGLILVDALMPGTDGFVFVQRLMQEPAPTPAIILMVSTSDRRTFRERCEGLEIAAYLEKPISQSDLLQAVASAMNVGTQTVLIPDTAARDDVEPLRILVAEDMPANQKVVATILAKRGHRIEAVANGRDAVDRALHEPFDVVIMDVQMPTMDGLQATAAIRAAEPAGRPRLPIIAMTAHAMEGDREKCLAAGMDAYLSKPIDARKLVDIVESFGMRSDPQPDVPAAKETAPPSSTQSADPSAPRARNDSDAVCDLQAALARLDGNQQLLKDMIGFFREDAPELLAQLSAGLEQRDADEVRRTAHGLKGLASTFDAQATMASALKVEQAAIDRNLDLATELLHQLQQDVERLTAALPDSESSQDSPHDVPKQRD